MICVTDIRKAIKALDLSGRSVCIHSSLRSFGVLENGAQTVLTGFLSAGCSVMIPSFTDDFLCLPAEGNIYKRNAWNKELEQLCSAGKNRIYFSETNEINKDMGELSAAVIKTNNRIRGNHSLCSFAAVGQKAEQLIARQDALHVFMPFENLINDNGYVVLMGVGFESMTLLHYAEQKAGRNLFRRWANDENGMPVETENGGCSEGFPNLMKGLSDITKTITVGSSTWRVLNAKTALLRAVEIIRANPSITHCDDNHCIRCNDAIAGGPVLS